MALTAKNLIQQCEDDIDYSTDNIILFTWNPDNRKVGTDENTQMKWDTMVARHLKHLSRVSKRFCVVAELSPVGRLHCHGWFSLDDKYKWNKSVQPHFRMHGNLRVNKMKSAKAFYYYKQDINETPGLANIRDDCLVYCHRNYRSMLGNIKQKYTNEALTKVKHKSMDITSFFAFDDEPVIQ